ncbi:hypothetical protein FHR83_006677 [Actinoplanes campanulatus]|uniref:DUF1376 domain-containing protein n=1 Tax=Actinoplanes campanulatus TaxID=113559 RepID=A0A7W5AME5_9ACTN|nr:hypothetical protein [Actinoplanes campanulatus]MBB3098971.1 hypothetical protein [Actinoplanes campanulatus]GGN39636.1 hypothetical protein GCM10010109_67790 [Actinoplanes campanulatus]GID40144.1 hypothetical protein Aca09nite_66500 [Actinoplanes campanulatus]
MTWFKVDDGLHSHRKAVRAGIPAMGLWVMAGSWCADNLSDGFIPDYMAARLDTNYEQNAECLVSAGLWVVAGKDGDSGWQFHQWVDQQPTAESVLEKRAEAKERMQRVRASRKANKEANAMMNEPANTSDGSPPVRANNERTSAEVRSAPTRPDPTTSSNEEVFGSPPAPDDDDLGGDDTTKKGTRIPDNFAVTPEMVKWAGRKCPDIDGRTETEKFVRYWKTKPGKDALKLSWKRTWQNWMTSAQQQLNNRQKSRMSGGLGAESNAPKAIPAGEKCSRHPSYRAGTCGPCRSESLVNRKAGSAA